MKRIELFCVCFLSAQLVLPKRKLLQQKTWMLISGLGCISQMIDF